MRIWSIHPRYLDAKGLVALWRETLLAKQVLSGKTKGYTRHPQLLRFKDCEKPLDAINLYLSHVYHEARNRGYNFNKDKVDWNFSDQKMTVTKGQIEYEKKHLLAKLKMRDIYRYKWFLDINDTVPHPLFEIINGNTETWEIMQ